MTTWRSVQPPATPAARRTPRRNGSPRQIDLFDGASLTDAPVWWELPEETRGALTGLMVRLILEHAQANGAVRRTEGGDDL